MSQTSITIRPASEEDLSILNTFEQNIIAVERPFNSSLKPTDAKYYDLGEFISHDHATIMLAIDNGAIVGSGFAQIRQSADYLVHKEHVHLGFMFVATTHRGKGINKMVIDALLNWSKQKGHTDVYLNVYAENESAIKAYEKVGFNKNITEMKIDLS